MSKLTEIKEYYEFRTKYLKDYGVVLSLLEKELLKEVGDLISLLEEKDVALKFYADEENNKSTHPTIGYIKYVSTVQLDGGMIARKAFNTSSNNEGEN